MCLDSLRKGHRRMTTGIERMTLKVSEAAKALGISEKSCYRAIKEGKVPSLQLGRRVLVPRYALEKLLGKPEPDPRLVPVPTIPRVPAFMQH